MLSEKLEIREKALIRARELAKIGDQSAQIALEEAIRIESNQPNCKFYEPGLVMLPMGVIMNADKEICELAKANKLLVNPEKTQSLISKLFSLGTSIDVMHKVSAIGEEQLHDFQLLGTQLLCRGEQIKIMRSRCENGKI